MAPLKVGREASFEAKHLAFPYQQQAVLAVRDRPYAAVFHEQGLGKTKIAIDVMLYWLSERVVDTILLVTKKSLVANWVREFGRHSSLVPRVLGDNRSANFYVFNSPARVVVAHFEVLKLERERIAMFQKTRRVAAILDESTKIKNPDSVLTQAAMALSPGFVRRIIMTGTPVANRPYDLWSQIWFLDHGAALGQDFEKWRRGADLASKLATDGQRRAAFETLLADLHARIEPFAVRETKASGVIHLPQKIVETIPTDWEPRQLDLYREIRDSLRAVVVTEGRLREDDADSILKRLLRLVQVASNPRLVDHDYSAEPGKLEPLRHRVSEIARRGEKCIIWTSFTDNVDWLTEEFAGLKAVRVHGQLTIAVRNQALDRFCQDPAVRVLVATPGAAKEGLTLTEANHAFFYDRSFSLDDYLQAQDRIHRVSQERTCFIYNMIMRDSVDEWVDVLIESKRVAAQFAQGDISPDVFLAEMTYDWPTVLAAVLGDTRDRRRS